MPGPRFRRGPPADDTEVVEREVMIREPTGHQSVDQNSIITPSAEPI